jgi:hypothetical protein
MMQVTGTFMMPLANLDEIARALSLAIAGII